MHDELSARYLASRGSGLPCAREYFTVMRAFTWFTYIS